MKYTVAYVISILLIFVVGITLAINYNNDKKLAEINASKDYRLEDFNKGERLAKEFMQILTITDNTTYNTVKSRLNQHLSTSLKDEIFKNSKYDGYNSVTARVVVKESKGDIIDKYTTVYKVDVIRYLGDLDVGQGITFLITIKNGLITDYRSI